MATVCPGRRERDAAKHALALRAAVAERHVVELDVGRRIVGQAIAPGASTTSGTLSRTASMRRSEARPAAQVLDSIVIMMSGDMVVSR